MTTLNYKGQGLSGLVTFIDFQVSDTEYKALRASPKELVAAPGVGLVILPLDAWFWVNTTEGAYDGAPTLLIGDVALGQPLYINGNEGGSYVDCASVIEALPGNTALLLKNTTGNEFTGGDPANTISGRVWYRIVPAAPFGA